MRHRDLQSWGRVFPPAHRVIEADRVSSHDGTVPLLAYGNGRSYGDSCLNADGILVDNDRRRRILGFDADAGIIRCEAGVQLADILAVAIPCGFFLPVTPGTQFVTIAGALANDVHGKNHHRRGSFGEHVSEFSIWRSDGSVSRCSRDENTGLFTATIGGMGLTGLILDVTLQLMRVGSPDIIQQVIRFESIDGYFASIGEVDAAHEYSVAWIDQMASGGSTGRGILVAGDHAPAGDGQAALPQRPKVRIPAAPPFNLVNRMTLKAFNELYFRRVPAGRSVTTSPWRSFFYPLDAIGAWNRLYGPRGLFQHQSVYPAKDAPDTTAKLLECVRRHRHASFLTVLKRFGDKPPVGVASFARPGFTLTLDFANQGSATLHLLDALDEIVLSAGGAVNPYKDARMGPATFAASVPRWRELESWRDPAFCSDFWRRTAMQLARPAAEQHPETAATEQSV